MFFKKVSTAPSNNLSKKKRLKSRTDLLSGQGYQEIIHTKKYFKFRRNQLSKFHFLSFPNKGKWFSCHNYSTQLQCMNEYLAISENENFVHDSLILINNRTKLPQNTVKPRPSVYFKKKLLLASHPAVVRSFVCHDLAKRLPRNPSISFFDF